MAGRAIGVPWNIKDALIVFILAWIGLPLLAIVVLSELAPVLPPVAQLLRAFEAGSLQASFVLVIINAISAFGLVLYYLKRYRSGLSDLGLRRFSLTRAAAYILGTVAAFMVLVPLAFVIISQLFPNFNPDQAQMNEFTQATTPAARRLSFIALVLLPPLVEELVFRGFIFPAFATRWGTTWGAISSSLLFGLAHLQFNVSVYTVVLGLLLCFMYAKLGSIWPGVAFHMLNNYLAFVALGQK
ncbi:MAG TPA: type II CAAX endopeptidase family protein [Candidatus Saccharimonadales bacterium]|nr:type II CAAX endopeptidase family protein [Candidatus Saccharimonadales bacterium]